MDSIRLWFHETRARQQPFRSTRTLFYDLHLWMKRSPSDLLAALRSRGRRPLLKLHFRVGLPGLPEEFRAFYGEILDQSDKIYVVRDGRDALVSYFFFRQRFDHGASDFREYLREPLRPNGQTVARYWSSHVDEWLDVGDVRVVRFEDLRSRYAETVCQLGRNLRLTRTNAPITTVRPDRARWRRALKRIVGMQRSTAVLPGSGDIGRWRAHFAPADKKLFKDQAGATLLRLGYETSSDW